MKKLKLNSKELRSIGFPDGPALSLAISTSEKNYKFNNKAWVLSLLKKLLANPADYTADEVLGQVAEKLAPQTEEDPGHEISLNNTGVNFNVFGSEHIAQTAFHQMYTAIKLPVAVAGALMPDAHSGYGLPIGGVLATDNAIIPYAVGVDIGCRMCLSVFDINPKELSSHEPQFSRIINDATLFGSGAQFLRAEEHEVMDRKDFLELPLLRGLHARAWKQLGTSGSGNHFVEFGTVTISRRDEVLGIDPGTYLGLLSHSGSRALGAHIANHYTRLARSIRRLPKEAANLAWLHMDEEAGAEYWMAMNLAGDYASACHDVIHDRIARQLGRKWIKRVENHHNFAWKECHEGREVIVHRKGATPAGEDVLGIIPGSMTTPGYIVKGKGLPESIASASHGAGRTMSRSEALKSVSHKAMRQELQKAGVTLLGGGLDESPFAYKNIDEVMLSQTRLVETVGSFMPKIVKMNGYGPGQLNKDRG